MKYNWGLLVFAVIAFLAAGGACAWYLTNRPLNEADFTAVTGTVKSADEKASGKSTYLELYLNESPIRFRVPSDGYRSSFDREAFFANVRPGSKITLQVEKAQL